MTRSVKRMVATLALTAVMLVGGASAALACIPYPGSTVVIVKGAACYASQQTVCP